MKHRKSQEISSSVYPEILQEGQFQVLEIALDLSVMSTSSVGMDCCPSAGQKCLLHG